MELRQSSQAFEPLLGAILARFIALLKVQQILGCLQFGFEVFQALLAFGAGEILFIGAALAERVQLLRRTGQVLFELLLIGFRRKVFFGDLLQLSDRASGSPAAARLEPCRSIRGRTGAGGAPRLAARYYRGRIIYDRHRTIEARTRASTVAG